MAHESYSPPVTRTDDNLQEQAKLSVLVIDDQHSVSEACAQVMSVLGYRALTASSVDGAVELMNRQPVDMVIADIKAWVGGAEAMRELKRKVPRVQIAIMTPSTCVPQAVQALRDGASGYIVKPFTKEELRVLAVRLAQRVALKEQQHGQENGTPNARDHLGRIVGQSQAMQQVFKAIHKVAFRRTPVLILGESGTGKELAARAIHETGPWRGRPFVTINCGALTPTLIETELFGHVRGAFTGAVQNKQGLLELAREGTLFLDEVAEIPIELQSRLLRSIQEKEFRPVGGTQNVPFPGRVIAATNRNMKEAVAAGRFREDLFFRLNVVSITLPPLRERKIDIPPLIEHILERLSEEQTATRRKTRWELSSDVLDRVLAHDWPGNIRELENCLEHAVTMASGPLIQMKDLPSTLQSSAACVSDSPQSVIPLDEMGRQAIERALSSTGGDKAMAARLLGIGKSTLYRKLDKYRQDG